MEFKLKWLDANYLAQARSKGVTNASIADSNETRLANLGIQEGTSASYNYAFDERWFKYLGKDIQDSHTYIRKSCACLIGKMNSSAMQLYRTTA